MEAVVSTHNSYSLSLVVLSVNQSSDKERATAAAHAPGAKKRKKKTDSAWLSAPPLTTTLIPPFKTPLLSLSQRHWRDERECAMRRL